MARSRFALSLAVAFFAALSIGPDAEAQIPPSSSTTSTPVPGAGHDYLGEIAETVNPATGSTSIRISATMPPGRGLTLPFSFAYDSNGVNYVASIGTPQYGGSAWQLPSSTIVSTGGWSESAPVVSATEIIWTAITDGGGREQCYGFVDYVYQDADGNRHNLNLSNYKGNTLADACTYDTVDWPTGFSGEVATQGGEDGNNPTAGAIVASIPLGNGAGVAVGPVTVTQPDGTVLYFANGAENDGFGTLPTTVEDRNGNVIQNHGTPFTRLQLL
jgi:hypothetical protein